jgi:hypothetical protein
MDFVAASLVPCVRPCSARAVKARDKAANAELCCDKGGPSCSSSQAIAIAWGPLHRTAGISLLSATPTASLFPLHRQQHPSRLHHSTRPPLCTFTCTFTCTSTSPTAAPARLASVRPVQPHLCIRRTTGVLPAQRPASCTPAQTSVGAGVQSSLSNDLSHGPLEPYHARPPLLRSQSSFWTSHDPPPTMAPAPSADASSAPLADYFFISGIESSQVYDERAQPNGSSIVTSPLAAPPVDETIEEDRALETDSIRPTSQEGLPNRGDSCRRRSGRLSEHRTSVGTVIGADAKHSASNRSSTTIKGVPLVGGSGLSEQDFENALRKFASERDNFLEEIQFTAGVAQQNRPTPTRGRPRPQRVQPPANDEGVGSSRSGVGSLRRRISTMQSSLKRQSSVARCKYDISIMLVRPFLSGSGY